MLYFQDVEGLGHVIVRPVFQAEDLVHILALGREHDDGHVALFADALANLNPIDFGQHHVQQDQVERLGRKLGKRLFAILCGIRFVPILLEAVF